MKLFIFDFDGTLFNTLNQLINDMNKALEIHDFPKLNYDEFKQMVGGNIDQVISNLLGNNSNEENIQKVKKTYLEIVRKGEDNLSEPFNEIPEVLRRLESENNLLAINSNRYTKSINYYINKFFNDIKFVDIQGHNPPCPSKPNPYGVFKIIEKAGVNKDDVIYVGDSQTDIYTAMNAGIKCIFVTWGYSNNTNLDGNIHRIINNPEELLEMSL